MSLQILIQKSQSHDTSGASVSDKRVSLRAVRNFMKIGRSRQASKDRERDSSTEDENRCKQRKWDFYCSFLMLYCQVINR